MTYDEHDPDPEVIADLQLRESSQRDRARTRTARYDWTPPVFVGQWRCRRPNCGQLVPITVEPMESLAVFNAELARRGEALIGIDTIMVCEDCRATARKAAAEKRREQVERMRCAIRELKQRETRPERERELIEQCKIWHHPDIDGLVQWLRENKHGKNGKRKDL